MSYSFIFSKNEKGAYNYVNKMPNIERNILHGREVYIPLKWDDSLYLDQTLGDIGAFCVHEYSSTTDFFFLPNSTIDNLSFGIMDNVSREIEIIYNNSVFKRLNISFILEYDVLDYVKKKILVYGDPVLKNHFGKYQN